MTSRNNLVHWLGKLGILLLLFLCVYVFFLLEPIWRPILRIFLTISAPFLIAGFISYLLHPLIERLHRTGVHRTIAILLIYSLFFGGLGVAAYKGIPLLVIQLKELGQRLPEFIEVYRGWINSFYENTSDLPEGVHEKFNEGLVKLENKLDGLITGTIQTTRSLIDWLIFAAIIPFIVFYMLKDYKLMKKAVWYMTPSKWRRTLLQFWKEIDKTLGNYIRGQLLVCAVIGTLASIGFWLTDIPYPLILGFIVGITNIIPYFGPILGAIPAAIIAMTISLKAVTTVVILIGILQFLEGNLLSPLIVGKSLHMHPVIIMFALLLGGEIAGILGLIFAVPLFAIFRATILHFYMRVSKH